MLRIQLRIHQTAAGFWFFCFLFFCKAVQSGVAGFARQRRRFSPFEASLRQPKQIRTGLSNALTWECVQNVASNWWQGGAEKELRSYLWLLPVSLYSPHSDFAVLPSFVLKSQSWSQSEAWRVKRGLFVLYSQNTSFTDACSDFLRLHHLQAPDCCPPKAKLCLPWTCRWSRLRWWKMESV